VLFRSAFGHDVDAVDDQELERDADGMFWIKTVGAGPLSVSALVERSAFGHDVGAVNDQDDWDNLENEPKRSGACTTNLIANA